VARIREVHTATGAHRVETQAFPKRVSDDVRRQADQLTFDDAVRLLGDSITGMLAESP